MHIGRSSACDFRLYGSDISSRHCRFSLLVTGERPVLFISDISTNGTSVNGEPLEKDKFTILNSGDRISFAKTADFVFRYLTDETRNKSFFDDYILMNQLGLGHYAVVKEARDRTTGDHVAVKIFHPVRIGASNPEDKKLKQEMELLLLISHSNIVKFISHYVEPVNEFSSTTYLVLEKVNSGELFQRIINKGKLRQDETKAIFRQLLGGLRYLHGRDIIHRDIKPENILLDITARGNNPGQTGPWDENEYDVRVKIADFGLAKFIGELKFTNTLCGTPAYVAPEVLNNNRNYSTKVDIWLAGVLLYVCLCGFPPFSDELGPPNMRDQITQGKYAFYLPYWDDICDTALELISNLLIVDPVERFDVVQAMEQSWFGDDDSFGSTLAVTATQEPATRLNSTKNGVLRAQSTIQPKTQRTISQIQPTTLRDRYTSELNTANGWEE